MTQTNLAEPLLNWYEEHGRKLPWRGSKDPYTIWISEIMLQQTRVETVIPYFQRWMDRFPDIPALATANQDSVLAAWEGLGYYSRARNLQRAAQIIVEHHGSQLPPEMQALQRLPGIGRYTAGAIASIAYDIDAAALDGNIRRVLARVFDVTLPARSPAGERRLWELAETHLPTGRAGDYNQALMDLGATLCTPRQPDCPRCPLRVQCLAHQHHVQEERPVTMPRRSTPHYTVTAAIIEHDGQFLLARRPATGLLGGLWEFPGGKQQPGEDLAQCLQREIHEELDAEVQVGEPFGVYRHAYTHFKVTLHAFFCRLVGGRTPRPLQATDLHWVPPAQLSAYPMGKIDRQIATRLMRALDDSPRHRNSSYAHR